MRPQRNRRTEVTVHVPEVGLPSAVSVTAYEYDCTVCGREHTARSVTGWLAEVFGLCPDLICRACGLPIATESGADEGYLHVGRGPSGEGPGITHGWDHVADGPVQP